MAAIYELRVQLAGIEPPIWRLLLVDADCDLAALHECIQAAMGWENCHLHCFRLENGQIASDTSIEPGPDDLDERTLRLREAAPEVGSRLEYLYDFGDEWLHEVSVEARYPTASADRLPRCTGGARACPPEDCGGPEQYLELLAGRHPDSRRRAPGREALPQDFDPEAFHLAEINADLDELATPARGAAPRR